MGGVLFEKRYYISPQLVKDSLVLIVGQNPGGEELNDGVPFSYNGRCGEMLRRYLEPLDEKGISYSITNAVNYYSVNNKTPTKKEVEQCLSELSDAVDYVKPKLIVAVGKVALGALTGDWGSILDKNGHILDYPIPILVCVHPSYVLRQGRNEAVFQKGILPLYSYFDKENSIQIICKDTIPPFAKEVGFDIETSSLRPERGYIKCFSVSDGETAIFVQVTNGEKR